LYLFPAAGHLTGRDVTSSGGHCHGKTRSGDRTHLPEQRRCAGKPPSSAHRIAEQRLADSTDLRTQVKWAHWNVKGLHFIQLHELFDAIASHLEEQTDSIAERITTLGGVANGTAREVASKSDLKEADLTASGGPAMLKYLVHNVAHHANALRGSGIWRFERRHHRRFVHADNSRTR